MNFDPTNFTLPAFDIVLLFKIVLLVFIALYAIFVFMLYNQIRSIERIPYFPPQVAGFYLKETALIYLLVVVSLFVITLVIV